MLSLTRQLKKKRKYYVKFLVIQKSILIIIFTIIYRAKISLFVKSNISFYYSITIV